MMIRDSIRRLHTAAFIKEVTDVDEILPLVDEVRNHLFRQDMTPVLETKERLLGSSAVHEKLGRWGQIGPY